MPQAKHSKEQYKQGPHFIRERFLHILIVVLFLLRRPLAGLPSMAIVLESGFSLVVFLEVNQLPVFAGVGAYHAIWPKSFKRSQVIVVEMGAFCVGILATQPPLKIFDTVLSHGLKITCKVY